MNEVTMMQGAVSEIAVVELHPSPTNPRRHFDKEKLEQLADSLKSEGLIEPLVVRRNPNGKAGWEIVAGERRWRAAKLAGLATLRCVIRELDDLQVLRVQMIENLQRDDLHELDEATGYEALLKNSGEGYDVKALAVEIGKSVSYVYQRLKLVELVPEAKKAFLEDRITAGHAILIARLQPKDQREALKVCMGNSWRGLMSVRELSRWIQEEVHLDLHAAPFPKADAELHPAAGPCTTCPKRTGFNPDLFPDVAKKDTCTDRVCFKAKIERFLERRRKELEAENPGKPIALVSTSWGRGYGDDDGGRIPKGTRFKDDWRPAKSAGECPSVQPGLIVFGPDLGKKLLVCAKPKCTKHRETWERQSARYDQQYKTDAKRAQLRERIRAAARQKAVQLALEKVEPAPAAKAAVRLERSDAELVAKVFFGDIWHEYRKQVLRVMGWELPKGKSPDDVARAKLPELDDPALQRFMLACALVRGLNLFHDPPRTLLKKRFGVDLAKVERQVKAELTKKKKPVKKGARSPRRRVQTSARRGA